MKILLFLALLAISSRAAETVRLTVDATRVTGQIGEKIYGHFLEHIYHSCNGGVWGEIVWNRSFEESLSKESWAITDGVLRSPAQDKKESRFDFGELTWSNLNVQVEMRRTANDGAVFLDVLVHDGHFTVVLGAGEDHHVELQQNIVRRDPRKRIEVKTVAQSDMRIESGRWYRLRVRCEGGSVQVWLDDQKTLEVKVQNPPRRGALALGARECRGEFRNLKVSSLDGNPLMDFLPTPARHWLAMGSADVVLDREQPLNSSQSLRLTAQSAGAGLAQKHVCVRKGDACRGSLWVRGEAAEGLVVRLVDGARTLAENIVAAPGGQWKELPLELVPNAGASDATLQILTRGKAAVWIDQVSLMPDSFRATGGFRSDLLEAMAALRPSVIRWPGGSFVSGYDWKHGIGPQNKRVGKPGWDEHDPLSFGIDEFMAFCRKMKAEPVIVVFVGRDKDPSSRAKYIKDACEFVEYCNGPASSTWGKVRAENGHPEPYGVKMWEIDNEIWGMTPDKYIEIVRQFVSAMKKIDPTIRTIACGSGGLGKTWGAGDIAIIEQCADVVDYLSPHHYENAENFASGIARAEGFWKDLGERIAKSKNPNMKIFMSEWNAQTTDWHTGLYAGGILNAFERNPVVGMATPALWLRHTSEVSWDNAFINFNHAGWFPAPNYVVMKLYREHFAPNLLELGGTLAGVNAVATRSADGKQVILKLVNPSEQAVDVKVEVTGGFVASQVSMKLVAPDNLKARNTLEQRDVVHVTDGTAKLDGGAVQLSLPRWSVGVVVLNQGRQM